MDYNTEVEEILTLLNVAMKQISALSNQAQNDGEEGAMYALKGTYLEIFIAQSNLIRKWELEKRGEFHKPIIPLHKD